MRSFSRILTLLLLLGGLGLGWWLYHRNPLAEENERLRAKQKELEEIVTRLVADTRVAEMVVTDQRKVDGVTETTFLFQEIARDGRPLPWRSLTVKGDTVYITALSIRFDDELVKKNDPLRGHGIILFDRMFGDRGPEYGVPIDSPDHVPDIYRGTAPQVSQFERDLWKDFWKLARDEKERAARGVQYAGGKGAYLPVDRNRKYHVTADAKGNLTLEWEPIPPIYLEALRNAQAAERARAATQPVR